MDFTITQDAVFATLNDLIRGIAITSMLALGYVAVLQLAAFHRRGMARVAALRERDAAAARAHLHLVK